MGASTDKTKLHGFRKGCGTYDSNGTTAGTSLTSVALIGERSQDTVFNIYLHFVSAGKFNTNK